MGYSIADVSMEPPAERVVGYCHACGGEIYEHQCYGTDGVLMIHHSDEAGGFDCIDDDFKSLNIEQRFELLGYEIVGNPWRPKRRTEG